MQILRALTLALTVLFTAASTTYAQGPRASDGHPDLSGIWQADDSKVFTTTRISIISFDK